jgi:hypothetical protein
VTHLPPTMDDGTLRHLLRRAQSRENTAFEALTRGMGWEQAAGGATWAGIDYLSPSSALFDARRMAAKTPGDSS